MNDMTPETGTALALPEPSALAVMFAQPEQVDSLLDRIEAEVRSHAPDVTTPKGRKAIASLAYDVARSKTALDNAGKSLTDDARKQIAAVDAERRKIRDRLDGLKAFARKPLDDWEAGEEMRVEGHKRALDAFNLNRVDANSTAEQVRHVLADIEALSAGEDWDEFQPIAEAKRDVALAHYAALLVAAKKREDDAAELARLRAKEEERARKDAEAAAAKAEAERLAKAKAEAERAAAEESERQRVAAEQAEARRLEAERAEAERQKREAAERQAAAERAAKEAEERAARVAKEREEAHARELTEARAREERAAQAERDRIAAERKAEDDARAKREKDRAHRNRIRDEIARALTPYLSHNANTLADALIDGKIPHTKVAL